VVRFLAVLEFEQFVLDDRVPYIPYNLSRAAQEFKSEPVVKDLAVIDD